MRFRTKIDTQKQNLIGVYATGAMLHIIRRY